MSAFELSRTVVPVERSRNRRKDRSMTNVTTASTPSTANF